MQKGAWALVLLRNEIGDKKFKKGIKAYLKQYQFKKCKYCRFYSSNGKQKRQKFIRFQYTLVALKKISIQKRQNKY